jgi:hypothetical protein
MFKRGDPAEGNRLWEHHPHYGSELSCRGGSGLMGLDQVPGGWLLEKREPGPYTVSFMETALHSCL